jgi:hypothetical protein
MDISHLVFIDLVKNLVDTAGVKVAKGNLMRIAINTGKQVERVDFASFDDLATAASAGDTPLSHLEGKAEYFGDGLFGLAACPFGQLADNYRNFFSKDLEQFKDLTAEFNAESKVTRDLKVGLGAGVGPFCIFHQPMRSQAGSNITIDGRPVEILQLACRNDKGDKAFAESLIAEYGCDRGQVEEVMGENMCCYGIRVKA